MKRPPREQHQIRRRVRQRASRSPATGPGPRTGRPRSPRSRTGRMSPRAPAPAGRAGHSRRGCALTPTIAAMLKMFEPSSTPRLSAALSPRHRRQARRELRRIGRERGQQAEHRLVDSKAAAEAVEPAGEQSSGGQRGGKRRREQEQRDWRGHRQTAGPAGGRQRAVRSGREVVHDRGLADPTSRHAAADSSIAVTAPCRPRDRARGIRRRGSGLRSLA